MVVIHPSPKPKLGQLESSFLILDFGVDGDWRQLLGMVDAGLGQAPLPSTLVILQAGMTDRLQTADDLAHFVAGWRGLRERGWNAVWVLPHYDVARSGVVAALKSAGFGVHNSAVDGACFVEIHKPDGTIQTGMPGPAL